MIFLTDKEFVDILNRLEPLKSMSVTTRTEGDALALSEELKASQGRIRVLERKLEDTIKMFTEIDNRTKWSEVEPEWWVNMVTFARSIREILKKP